MARLPQPGADAEIWGDVLNEYLGVSLSSDGTLKPTAVPVSSVAGKTGAVTLAKSDVGLSNADNTSDANKPVSTAQQTALDARLVWVDVVDANTLRPTNAERVIWIGGTTRPVNMATGDLWIKELS